MSADALDALDALSRQSCATRRPKYPAPTTKRSSNCRHWVIRRICWLAQRNHWFRNYKWLWIVSRIFQDSWKFAKILGISGNSGNPWNFKPLGLASLIQNLVPCSADFHEKCSRKVQTEKSQLTKFESPLGTASRVSERCLWVRPSLSQNFRGTSSCFFGGIRVSAIYFRELSRNSWQETWFSHV